MNVLEKELVKTGNKSVEASNELINEVRLLLESNEANERNVLSAVGLDNNLRYVERVKEDTIIRNRGKEILGKEIVHVDDIKNLCVKYRLFMRTANKYRGHIPPELGAELNRFCSEKNVVLSANAERNNFFIIAPPRMFEDYKNPLGVVKEGFEKNKKDRREREEQIRQAREERERMRLKDDPILVYRLPDNPNYYAVIKSWGHDFTLVRRIYGYFTKATTLKKVTSILWGAYLALATLLSISVAAMVNWDGKADIAPQLAFIFIYCPGLIFTFVWMSEVFIASIKNAIKKATSHERDFYQVNLANR